MQSIDPVDILIIGTLIGSAVVGGVFFTFSTFVMKALARIPSHEGIRAMQSINIVVINPLVMGALFGTALLSLLIIGLIIAGIISSPYLLLGSIFYLAGTFMITALGNVPLNNLLAEVAPDNGRKAEEIWSLYLKKWTFLNHIRTSSAILASVFLTLALID